MKPPIIRPTAIATPPPSDQSQTATSTSATPQPSLSTRVTTITTTAQQHPPTTITNDIITTSVTNPISSQTSITNAQTIPTNQVQQAPLALTTTQAKTQVSAPPQILDQAPTAINQSQITPQILQLKTTKIQSPQVSINTPTQQQLIPLATTPTTTGPTALVIIPQHSTTATVIPPPTPKSSSNLTTKSIPITSTVVTGVPAAHVTLPTTTQSAPIQLQTSTTHVPNIATPVPMTAHQQSTTVVTPSIANRPPSTLSVVPITTTSANIKAEPNKYTCCLLDNGVRCDRVAGNASFSARIQKIVKTKEMNYNLDSSVRHTYICEHHKAIITVAKKSTMARDTKANARNYTVNNNATNIAPQPNVNYNDFSLRQQQTLQHPVNLEMIANQNRLANNHAGVLNNTMPIPRPGAQIAYGHYQGPHQNQVAFDNLGGDIIPSSSGGVDVDLQQLQVNTLRRYKRHFRVQTRPGLNKMQLAESLKSHFRTLPIIEKEAITYFVYIVKCYRNKLDHNPKAD